MLTQRVRLQLSTALFYGAALFGGAGTFFWFEGWLFLTFVMVFNALNEHFNDTQLLALRSKSLYDIPKSFWTSQSYWILLFLFSVWLFANGLDSKRFPISEITMIFQVFGGILTLLCLAVMFWAIEWNYSTAVVMKSASKKRRTALSMGPYSKVRHPMYLSSCMLLPCVSLMLGSVLGLWMASVFIIWLCIHTFYEDRQLQAHAKGYQQYVRKVPKRLIPYVY